MKNKLTSLVLLAASLVTASHAQLTLHTFSNLSSQTLFFGDWSDTGDPFAGSATPSFLLTQNVDSFAIAGASNADLSYFEHVFTAPVNLGASDQLALSLRLLDGNTADSLTVFLIDSSALTASATFLASDFTSNAFSEFIVSFTADAGFDRTGVTGFRISGNDPFAGGVVGMEIDNLATATNPVPEPSTYGLMAAAALTLGIAYRKRRKS